MIWTNTKFEGHWPVGTAAIVEADRREEAAYLLSRELAEQGLPQSVDVADMIPFTGGVQILCDGDY